MDNDEWLKQYDIIHYHRSLGPYEKMPELLQRLKNLGIVTIMDLDDGSITAIGTVDGTQIAVGDVSGDILIGNNGSSPSTLRQYSVTGSNITEVQNVRLGGNGQNLMISPDENHVIFTVSVENF